MPFPPTLGTDEFNAAFVATFEAYLAGKFPEGDLPPTFAFYYGLAGDADLPSAGTMGPGQLGDWPAFRSTWIGLAGIGDLAAGSLAGKSDLPLGATASFLGGFFGFVGGIGGTDTALPLPPVPSYGSIGEPTQGASAPAYPPALGLDPGALAFGSLFSGTESYFEASYFLGVISGFIGQQDTAVGTPPPPSAAITNNPVPRSGTTDPIATFQAYLVASPESYLFPLRLAGALDIVDPVAGPLGKNQNSDPAGSQAQLDGQFGVFVGQVQPPFTTTRLPRLAFGPFLNLEGLTYEIELDAFAKFGLTQIQYRIYANDQPTPPFNVINLAGQASYTTNLILTLDNASATLQADAILTDAFGNVATQSVLLPGIPDTLAPTAPSFLYLAQLPDGTWIFVWGPSTDNFVVDHYQIDQVDANGNPLATLAWGVAQNFYTLVGPNLAGNHYHVTAFDPAGNVSPPSPIAMAVANAAAEPQISNVLAQQIAGTSTIRTSWSVTPLGSPCTAVVVDSQDRPLSPAIVSTNGQATLSLPTPIGVGIYRVKVTA